MLQRKNKNENKHLANDFKMRAPFAAYRPVEYDGYKPFLDFKPVIDGYLEKLFAAGSALDEGNKDAIDPLIADMAAKAERHLEQQRIEHADKIHGFHHRRSGDQRAFARELETLKEAHAQNEQELEQIERRCNVAKF
jgi:hypothetical protein